MLKNEINSLNNEEKKIRQANNQINEKLTAAEEAIRDCENDLSDSFNNCYNFCICTKPRLTYFCIY